MHIFKFVVLFTLLHTSLFAYTDNDIDGVDDVVDACLNTPFDELVDERGCSYDKVYRGEGTLKVGADVSFDDFSDTTTDYNLYANYRYNNWDISLSNASYSTYDSFNESTNATGDIYLSAGYFFDEENFSTKVSLGTKLATADDDVGTGENDYIASVNVDYLLDDDKDIFVYVGYTVSGDSADIDYEDYLSYSLGSGYMIDSKWYSSLAYDYSASQYPDSEAYQSVSWFNSYAISEQFFTTLNYAYGLDTLSYAHTLSLKFGVHFE